MLPMMGAWGVVSRLVLKVKYAAFTQDVVVWESRGRGARLCVHI